MGIGFDYDSSKAFPKKESPRFILLAERNVAVSIIEVKSSSELGKDVCPSRCPIKAAGYLGNHASQLATNH